MLYRIVSSCVRVLLGCYCLLAILTVPEGKQQWTTTVVYLAVAVLLIDPAIRCLMTCSISPFGRLVDNRRIYRE